MSSFRLSKHNLFNIMLVVIIGLILYGIIKYIPTKTFENVFKIPVFAKLDQEPLEFKFAIGGEGSTADYQLAEPMGVDIADNGDIFVADTSDNLIKVFDQNGKFKVSFGKKDLFYLPADLAVNKTEVMVVDSRNSRIQVFDLNGKFLRTFAGPELGKKIGAWIPQSIHIALTGEIYVSDVFYHRVIVFDQSGAVKKQLGVPGTGSGQLMYPNGIVVNKAGELYVSDSNNGRIQIFDASGKFLNTLSNKDQPVGFSMPRGLALDAEGNIYVVETFGHALRTMEVKKDQLVDTRLIGTRGVGDGEMNFPNDFAVRGEMLCIADRANNRILVYQIIKD